MDRRDLKSASTYVNNLLASRGLLRGHAIPFHKPADDDTTPAKIINLVHELIARRDREADQREDLALTLRTLRSAEVKQTETIDQLKEKNLTLERKNAILESQARSFGATLHTVEASANALRHEAARAKTLLTQVRTQCANDIRKRDIQIQKMKERLAGDGKRGLARLPMITIGGGGGGGTCAAEEEAAAAPSSLVQDTSDFLTTLSQGLADENDNLIALVRQTLSTLKVIQGLPDDGGFSSLDEGEEEGDVENPVVAPPASFDALSDGLDGVLYSLRTLLNQPNYVPLEELADRDAEIERLKQRNDTLEEEWKKALELVEGWNKTLGRKFATGTGMTTVTEITDAGAGEECRKAKERTLLGDASGNENPCAEEGKLVDKDKGIAMVECTKDDDEMMDGDGPGDGVHLVQAEEAEGDEEPTPPESLTRRRSLRNKEKLKPKPSPAAVQKKKRKSTRRTRAGSYTPQEVEGMVGAL